MAITVTKISETEYRVGNKVIYEDTEGRLIARTELTEPEANAFYNFVGKRKLTTLQKTKCASPKKSAFLDWYVKYERA